MTSLVSKWCWTPSGDLLPCGTAAAEQFPPLAVLRRGWCLEPLPSQASCEVNNRDSHTRETAIKEDQDAQGPLAAVGPVRVFPCSHPLCQLEPPVRMSRSRGLEEENQQVPKATLLPRLPTSGTHTKKGGTMQEYQSSPIPCYFKSRNQGIYTSRCPKTRGLCRFYASRSSYIEEY